MRRRSRLDRLVDFFRPAGGGPAATLLLSRERLAAARSLIGAYYAVVLCFAAGELFALWVVPRPSLHRPWGLGLALFHVLSHLTLGVGFPKNVLWLALFLGFSPFRPALGSRRPGWRRAVFDLPLLGPWLRRGFERWRPVRPGA